MKVSISEVFYSIQGEGKTMGMPSVFIRLGGCNLLCGGKGTKEDKKLHDGATWRCDTIEVWMKSKAKDVEEILTDDQHERIASGAHVIITGGEPLMQMKGVESLVYYLKSKHKKAFIEIETNGTISPSSYLSKTVDQWNCSPKISNSGMSKDLFYIPAVIKKLNKLNTIFKFVITIKEDFNEAMNLYSSFIDADKIWLMPSGENQFLLNQSKGIVAEICKKYCLNFSSRLHIELWNQKTGV
jgi:organic radical activating enzyme